MQLGSAEVKVADGPQSPDGDLEVVAEISNLEKSLHDDSMVLTSPNLLAFLRWHPLQAARSSSGSGRTRP